MFLACGAQPTCEVIAWRTGVIAAAHGIRVHVPRRLIRDFSAESGKGNLSREVKAAINRSDFVFALVTDPFDAYLQAELDFAFHKKKLIFPLVDRAVEDSALLKRLPCILKFSPRSRPRQIQARLAEFLTNKKLGQKMEAAVRALVGIALELFSEPTSSSSFSSVGEEQE